METFSFLLGVIMLVCTVILVYFIAKLVVSIIILLPLLALFDEKRIHNPNNKDKPSQPLSIFISLASGIVTYIISFVLIKWFFINIL